MSEPTPEAMVAAREMFLKVARNYCITSGRSVEDIACELAAIIDREHTARAA